MVFRKMVVLSHLNSVEEDNMREILEGAVLVLAIVLLCTILLMPGQVTSGLIPGHIRSFCQAQHEVYGATYESCIESYKKHRE